MGGGLFELRPSGRSGIGRAFYFFLVGRRVVIGHAFIKKTRETPDRELKIARRRVGELQKELRRRGFANGGWREVRSDPRFASELRVLTVELLARPERRAAALLVAHSLAHPDPLVRIAAATAAAEVLQQGRGLARERFRIYLHDEDSLVRMLAATCLARFAPGDPSLAPLTMAEPTPPAHDPIHTSTIVHGTWAAGSEWWRLAGDYFRYLRTAAAPDLYAGDDLFHWSGAWKESARKRGAKQLAKWAAAHQAPCLNLFTHSHGGNVAMLATHRGLTVGRLVLLSCPVHWTKYRPKPGTVGGMLSIRTHLDLVILGDRGGQRFPKDSGIRERILDLWFSHSASHEPEVWKANHLEQALPGSVCAHAP